MDLKPVILRALAHTQTPIHPPGVLPDTKTRYCTGAFINTPSHSDAKHCVPPLNRVDGPVDGRSELSSTAPLHTPRHPMHPPGVLPDTKTRYCTGAFINTPPHFNASTASPRNHSR